MEAAKLLAFTEEEFIKTLELGDKVQQLTHYYHIHPHQYIHQPQHTREAIIIIASSNRNSQQRFQTMYDKHEPFQDLDTRGSDDDSSPLSSTFWTKRNKIIIGAIGGAVLAGLALFLILFLVLGGSGGDDVEEKYNPFILKAAAKDPMNYTLILENTREVSESPTNPEAKYLAVQVETLHDHLLSVKIFDANKTRWEVPKALEELDRSDLPGEMDVSTFINNFQHYPLEKLGIELQSEPFGWELWGAETQKMDFPIVSTFSKPLQFFDKYIEYELELPCEAVFGLPQKSPTILLKEGNYTMWNQYHIDSAKGEEGMGSISFLLCRVNPEKHLALFLDNSNAHTVSIWKTDNTTHFNYKLTGGIIDLKIFHLGEPTAILKLYHAFVGKPACPPLWSFGLEHSKEGCDSLESLESIVANYTTSNTPLDALWMDQTLMDNYKTFTISKDRYPNLKKKLEEWKSQGIHFVQTLLPHIKEADYPIYNTLIKEKLFVKDPRNETEEPQKTKGADTDSCIFVDLFKKGSQDLIADGLTELSKSSLFDGIWIRQEAPFTTCNGFCDSPSQNKKHDPHEYDKLPFKPINLQNSTLPLASYSSIANHFNSHNIFPLLLAKSIFDTIVRDEFDYRARIASSVAAPRLANYSTLWRGNVKSEWETLSQIIVETVAYNLAGIPFVGYPVCGYHTTESLELCLRWYQLAAYLPEMRIYHNGKGKVEPFVLGEKAVSQALERRYEVIRFLYTKLSEAELWGGPVWEPLGFLFRDDQKCFDEALMNDTFVVGKTLYVTPSLKPGQNEVKVYLPNYHWYKLSDLTIANEYEPNKKEGKHVTFPATLNYTNVFIKGGSIFPVQNGAVKNTKELTDAPATLIIAPDHEGKARGTMLVARDIEFELVKQYYNHYSFTFANGIFRINLIEGYYNPMEAPIDFFKEIVILNSPMKNIAYACLLTNELVLYQLSYSYNPENKSLKIFTPGGLHLKLKDIDSITFGEEPTKNLCRRENKITDLKYDADRKTAVVDLQSTDHESYAANFKLLNDSILYLAIEPSDGNEYWKVPDVLEPGIRDDVKAKLNLDSYGLKLPKVYSEFGFSIVDPKKETNKVLATEGKWLFQKERFMEFSIRLYGSRIYGLGERITDFELKDGWYTMFSKGVPSPIETRKRPGNNMYGSYPFCMFQLSSKETDFAAIFTLTSNALDVRVQHEANEGTVLTHVLTGSVLEFFVIQKSSPENIIKQFHTIIGKPTLVPYWAFGYHQCRWGYDTQEKMEEVIKKFDDMKIPLDVMWSDIDYMIEYEDFTLDQKRYPSMPEFLGKLKERNITYVPIVDAGIARKKGYEGYEKGKALDLFIKSAVTGEDLIGIVWPGYAVFTDFSHPEAESYWTSHLAEMHKILPFDGIWLDMNELTSFCDGECSDELHYVDNEFTTTVDDMLIYYPGHKRLNHMTISLSAKHYNGQTEHNMHSMYGFYTIKATSKYFDTIAQKRPFIISRSTFPGTGRYGSHWLGDNYALPEFMKYSITGIYNFQMFGIPFVGADVCGFIGHVDLEMCKRWMQLGAFYPFYRNHKEKFWEHHEPFVDEELAKISTHAIKTRYTLFRYMYSNYFEVALNGGTFFRPLFWEFPTDPQAYSHNEITFMLGPGLKVSPALHPTNATTFTSYFPNADWYELYTGKRILAYQEKAVSGKTIQLDSSYHPTPVLNVHLKGGSIVPVSVAAGNNLAETLQNHIALILAPFKGRASGHLYYDDDGHNTIQKGNYQSIQVAVTNQLMLFVSGHRKFEYKYQDDFLDEIKMYGASQYKNTKCVVMGLNDGSVKIIENGYDKDTETLKFYPKQNIGNVWNITWSDKHCGPSVYEINYQFHIYFDSLQ
eukprot:TRINITY_DN1019_c0_g1_i1.p1 TRINITY_DN1019_c0_g1~~TRINITY_DN1019_c0_g1_i1.p1  ORF type:complete len:1852 (+),score=180.84 TRINITY_DN1019_c0_g1_i1:3096-8651(+)